MEFTEKIEQTSNELEHKVATVGRLCGDCTLCCKLMYVGDINKAAGKWCPDCKPGVGCSRYEDRPASCKGFYCDWRLNKNLPDYWKPTISKIVFVKNFQDDGKMSNVLFVDDGYPTAWKKEPYYSEIKRNAARYLEQGVFTYVKTSRGKALLILPQKEVEVTNKGAVVGAD